MATPLQRSIGASLVSNISASRDDGVSTVTAYGDRVAAQFPASLTGLIGSETMRITTVRFLVADPPSFDTRLSLRYQDGLPHATRLVAGRWPEATATPLRTMSLSGQPVVPGGRDTAEDPPNVIQGAISTATVTETGVQLGDRLAVVSLDGSDAPNFRCRTGSPPTEIEIVGIYEALDPASAYWAGDDDLLQPAQLGSEDNPIAGVTAYVPAEMYPNLASSRLPVPLRVALRRRPGAARRKPGAAAPVRPPAARGRRAARAPPARRASSSCRTGLPPILERFTEEQALTETVLSIATIGPLGLAAGAMAMVALLLVQRRRATLALARGRGASGALVLGTQLWESILLAGGAALLGLVLALGLVPGRGSRALRDPRDRGRDHRHAAPRRVRAGRRPGDRSATWSATTPRHSA